MNRIITTSDCNECHHNAVCKYRGNPEKVMKKLKKTIYDIRDVNADYLFEQMMEQFNVNITICCPDFLQRQPNMRKAIE